MPGPGRQRPPLAEVKIDVRQVIEMLHMKYGDLIGQLMAENANLQVGFETAQAEIAQLRSHVAALRGDAGVVNVAAPASAAVEAGAAAG